ncbi:MAG: hypothetical protein KGL39_11295 [Patescibacteria group bacterium]|nr:hypothetical protein [Patescibacteria group bacterium]
MGKVILGFAIVAALIVFLVKAHLNDFERRHPVPTWAERVTQPDSPRPATYERIVREYGDPDGQGRDDSGKLAARLDCARCKSVRWITYRKAKVQFFFMPSAGEWVLMDYRDSETGRTLSPVEMATRIVVFK